MTDQPLVVHPSIADDGPDDPTIRALTLPPGIPEVISFDRVQEMLTALGIGPLDDLCGFTLHSNAIEAEFYAKDHLGMRFLRGNDGVVATHKVVIRIDRDNSWLFQKRPNIHDDGPKEG